MLAGRTFCRIAAPIRSKRSGQERDRLLQARIAFATSSSILIVEATLMGIVKRQLGDRRLGFPLEFPLVDSDDVLVCSDRRIPQERRKANITLEDIELLLSQMRRRESSRD